LVRRGRGWPGLPPRRMGCHLQEGLDDAGEGGEASTVGQVLEHWDTLRAITAGRSIRFHPVVGRFNLRLLQETQQFPRLVVAPQHPQQLLIVLVLQGPVS
jgi:hypothetical protein